MPRQKPLHPPQWYQKTYPNTRVQGLEETMVNLNKILPTIKGATERGLVLAAAHIRVETEKTPVYTPLDIGNLRSSWFIASKTRVAAGDNWNRGFKLEGGQHNYRADVARLQDDHTSNRNEAFGMAKASSDHYHEVVICGYTAHYAVYVHENLEAHFSKADSGPKWFEKALNRNHKKILEIVAEHSKFD